MCCVICTDRFLPYVEISSTQCGHLFHSECLLKWIDCSQTCPECRRSVSSTNTSKLCFNFVPNNNSYTAHLENEIYTLNTKLNEKGMELESTKKKVKDLQLYLKTVEKIVELDHKKELAFQSILLRLKHKLIPFTTLETEVQSLEQENKKLCKEMEYYISIKTILTGCPRDVDSILHETQSKAATEIGNIAASRLATHCSVLKHKLRCVIEEKNQLQNEVNDTNKSLGLSTISLENSERKVNKIEEQLKRSNEMNNFLLVQNRFISPNSVFEEISPNNFSTSCEETTKMNDKHTIPFEAPTVKKM